MQRKYTLLKDEADVRDKSVPSLTNGSSSVDLSQWLPDVRNQGQEGSCTAFAGTGILAWLFNRYKSESLVFSPQFFYRSERIFEHTTNEDAGAQSRTMMKVLATYGAPLESSFPYNDKEASKETPFSLLPEARKYRTGAYHRVNTLDTLRSVLASGYVASLGIEIYESFETDHVMATGVVPVPKKGELLMGAHEVYTYGYDDHRQVLLVRNSWGTNWGKKGNFELPYAFWPYVMDCWTCHLGNPW